MRCILLAAVAASVATPAVAQDAAAFRGFHIAAIGGYDHIAGKTDKTSGKAYGVTGGFDTTIGDSFVVGVAGEADWFSTHETRRNLAAAGDRLKLQAGRDLSATARIGVTAGPILVYACGGYTNEREILDYNGVTAGPPSSRKGNNLDGYRLGGGLEVDAGRFLVRAEYRYSNYEKNTKRNQLLAGVGVRF